MSISYGLMFVIKFVIVIVLTNLFTEISTSCFEMLRELSKSRTLHEFSVTLHFNVNIPGKICGHETWIKWNIID